MTYNLNIGACIHVCYKLLSTTRTTWLALVIMLSKPININEVVRDISQVYHSEL